MQTRIQTVIMPYNKAGNRSEITPPASLTYSLDLADITCKNIDRILFSKTEYVEMLVR